MLEMQKEEKLALVPSPEVTTVSLLLYWSILSHFKRWIYFPWNLFICCLRVAIPNLF